MNLSNIKTGDLLLFNSNNPLGILLKTFTSAEWNHTGIAVRIIKKNKSDFEISVDETGDLYVLESAQRNIDDIIEEYTTGARVVKIEKMFDRYNKIGIRKIHDKFRNKLLKEKTKDFIMEFRNSQFPDNVKPFLAVWLGISTENSNKNNMFCSKLSAYYYSFCLPAQFELLTGTKYNGDLTSLFGSNSYRNENLMTPGDYVNMVTSKALIFSGNEEIVRYIHGDLWYIILHPLIITFFICTLLWIILNQSTNISSTKK